MIKLRRSGCVRAYSTEFTGTKLTACRCMVPQRDGEQDKKTYILTFTTSPEAVQGQFVPGRGDDELVLTTEGRLTFLSSFNKNIANTA
ncbi:MAG: hypothetical protein IPI95_15360 [Flavobacteriales bacterium]|nr:hypothetical protein [Flavobacteriales bacterium]